MRAVVFDFDDTLYSTSDKKDIDSNLASTILNTIKNLAKKDTKIYIISNASLSWIEQALNSLGLRDIIPMYAEIISVMDQNLQAPVSIWKSIAFHKHLDLRNVKELIAFGDNVFDREASLNVKKSYPHVIVKNILFLKSPSSSVLVQEHLFVQDNIDWILNTNSDLDLSILVN